VKRAPGLDLLLLLALWALLAWRGFPFPGLDDCLFTGAALHMAAGGGLENPLLESSGPYYLYPPFYDFFLATWLRIAGIGAATVIGFHLAVCLATSALVLGIFRAWGRGGWAWAGVLVYIDYVAAFGLRSDTLGFFFVVLSVRLGLASARAGAGFAPFFAFLGMATHPPLLALALPWVFWLVVTKPPSRIGAVAGGVGVGVLLLFILHGDLAGFARGFLENRAASREDTGAWLAREWFLPPNIFKVALLPLLSLVLAGRKMRREGVSAADLAFLLALALGLYVTVSSLSGNRIFGLISTLGMLGYLTATPDAGAKARLAAGIVVALFCLSIGRPLAEGLLMSKPSVGDGQALREQLRQTPHTRVIIDSWSLRYVFDFRPPPGAAYIRTSKRPRDGRVLLSPGECGVISADSTDGFNLTDPGLPAPVYLRIAGRPVGRWITNKAKMVFIIRSTP
jgi:hypothetical protein